MSFLDTVKKLLGGRPIDVSELNRRATREDRKPRCQAPAKDPLEGIEVTDEYKTVRALLEAGEPILLVSGNAGTGKSTLIRYLRAVLKRRLVVAAPTGVAALNVGGVTVHSFFHLPPKIHSDEDIKLVYDRRLYQKLELLVIDECSMLRCDLLDSVDKFLRKNRSDGRPFGGVQLLLVGDLHQLPPVAPKKEWDVLGAKGYASRYFFSALGLQKTSLKWLELKTVYRQKDPAFVNLLNTIRVADDIDSAIAEINRRCSVRDGFHADITLTCTNSKADQINRDELMRLESEEYSFKGRIEGEFCFEHDRLPSPLDLRLKAGARVMFTKNGSHWVNGSLGVVRRVDPKSTQVELVGADSGTTWDVTPETWETYKYQYDSEQDQIVAQCVGRYTQYPLMLAWAVTIHKSQGNTLDKVLVDLGSGAFDSGQVYVALSRCRTIGGIRLERPIRRTDVRCDPIIRRFHHALAEMQEGAQQIQTGRPGPEAVHRGEQ